VNGWSKKIFSRRRTRAHHIGAVGSRFSSLDVRRLQFELYDERKLAYAGQRVRQITNKDVMLCDQTLFRIRPPSIFLLLQEIQ
jgi:hypothetical protein